MNITSSNIDSVFARLNQKLGYAGIEVSLVVCGGAALIATGLVQRVTGDIDVLASASAHPGRAPELVPLIQIPSELEPIVAEIGHDLGLEPDWLNAGPALLHQWGFPHGLDERLIRRRYGNFLTIYFIGRFDQIHLKILAAMDPTTGPRHLHDLLELEPTDDEARASVRWLLRRETSIEFRGRLADVLERIGHERIAGEL